MLENITGKKKFAQIMKKNLEDIIIYFFEEEQNFGILCKIEDVAFYPELPDAINGEFRPLTLFFLAGYTFETARIEDECLIFEAGFGRDEFGSVVTVPLLSIVQVIVDETPICINLSVYKEEDDELTKASNADREDLDGEKNSMASFLNNPENSKFLK